ncbi:hypothetical protein E2I00_008425, partial [Balaenoptera physalus]
PAEATRKRHCTGGGSKTPPEVTGASPQPQAVFRQRKPVLAADNGVPAGVESSVTSEEAGEGRGAAAEIRGPQRSKRGARSPPSPAHVPGTWEAGTRLRTGRQEQPTHSQSPGRLPAFSLPALSCRGRSPSTSRPHTDLPGSQPAKQSSTGITRRLGGPVGARTREPRAGGERAPGPSPSAAGPSVFIHRATTRRGTPRAARAGTGYFAERGSSSQCADPASEPQDSRARKQHPQGRHGHLPALRRLLGFPVPTKGV